MNGEEYLNLLKLCDSDIKNLISELDTLKNNATMIQGIAYDKDKVQTSKSGDSLCKLVVKITELEQKINNKIDYYVDLRDKVCDVIGMIKDPDEKRIIHLYYADFKTIGEISKITHFSESWVKKIKSKGIKAVDKLIK